MTGSNSRLICGVRRRFWPSVVAAIAGIGDAAIEDVADERLHLRNDRAERVPVIVIGIAGQCCRMGDERPPVECFTVVATLTLTPNSSGRCAVSAASFNPQNRFARRPKIGKFDYLSGPNHPAHSIAFKFFTDDFPVCPEIGERCFGTLWA